MSADHLSFTNDNERSSVCHQGKLTRSLSILSLRSVNHPHTLSISKRPVLSSSKPEPILIHGDPFFHFLPRVMYALALNG